MDASINSSELQSQSDFPGGSPLVIDVREAPAFHSASAWCRDGQDDTHTWNPAAHAQAS